METFNDFIRKRRSKRIFTDEEVDADAVSLILQAALMSPTSRNLRGCHFVVVDDKMSLEKLADAKDSGSSFLRKVPLAVVVIGDPNLTDCWVEDCSIAAAAMQFQAEDLGLGSCWVQIRGRGLSDGTSACDVVRGILDIPDSLDVLCVLGIGYSDEKLKPHDEKSLKWENVHINHF